jgi:signal transduction histidine kinase
MWKGTTRSRGPDGTPRYRVGIVVRYGAAVVASALATALGIYASHGWHLKISFVTFYLSLIMVVAWIGGLWPGVLSTLACTLIAIYFWAEPIHDFAVESRDDAISLLSFFVLGLMTSLLCEELHTTRRKEHEARVAREETLAVVAHELKNPLAAIYIALSLIDRQAASGLPGDRLRALVARIRRLSAGMDHLVRDLLDAAAIEAGALTIVKAPEGVEPLLKEAVESHLDAAAQKQIHLEAITSPGCPRVLCDRPRVLQTLSNLIGNAVKFTPVGGAVSARAEAIDEGVRFSVLDSGPGVPGELLPHIFDRYRHGELHTGAETGLGLYIAWGIIQSHEGSSIVVTSQPGKGSTFSFVLSTAREVDVAGDEESG